MASFAGIVPDRHRFDIDRLQVTVMAMLCNPHRAFQNSPQGWLARLMHNARLEGLADVA